MTNEQKSEKPKEHPQTLWGSLITIAVAVTICGAMFAAYADQRDMTDVEAQILVDDLASAISAAADEAENRIIEFTLPSEIGDENYSLQITDNEIILETSSFTKTTPVTTRVYTHGVIPGATLEISKYGDYVVLAQQGSISRGWAWVYITNENDNYSIDNISVQENWQNTNLDSGQYSVLLSDDGGAPLLKRSFQPQENQTLLILPWLSIINRAELRWENTSLDNLVLLITPWMSS